jgi:hypothetical protein
MKNSDASKLTESARPVLYDGQTFFPNSHYVLGLRPFVLIYSEGLWKNPSITQK